MKQPIEYVLIEASHKLKERASDLLQNDVSRAMEEGWRPVGGVSVVYTKQWAWSYSQAMVKGGVKP